MKVRLSLFLNQKGKMKNEDTFDLTNLHCGRYPCERCQLFTFKTSRNGFTKLLGYLLSLRLPQDSNSIRMLNRTGKYD
jgi:hypothetical protein